MLPARNRPHPVKIAEIGPVRVGWAFGEDARARVLGRLLAEAGAPSDEISHACPTCGSDAHGPLRASSGAVVVSIAHAGDLVVGAIASADAAASVGVDVEADRGDAPMGDLSALFAPAAPPSIREWTAIEAVAKADGRGLRIVPTGIRLSGEQGGLLPEGRIAVVQERTRIEVAPSPSPEGYVVSVAIDPARESAR